MDKVFLSIVVCTYNRPHFLRKCLLSLLEQKVDASLYEIIIVNNGNAKDLTKIVKHAKAINSTHQIQLVHEPQIGLGFARNKGVSVSLGKYVGFIDDDALADPLWITSFLEVFRKLRPSPLFIGGRIMPLLLADPPKWFSSSLETRSWGEEERYLKVGETFSGSNLFVNKSVLIQCGGFPTNVGMKGGVLSLGEETLLMLKAGIKKGWNNLAFYSPNILVSHAVTEKRLKIRYRWKRSIEMGRNFYRKRMFVSKFAKKKKPRNLRNHEVNSTPGTWFQFLVFVMEFFGKCIGFIYQGIYSYVHKENREL